MSIGRFARRAGLSIGALRHYADVGLLEPARVDPDTGYRYYAEDQHEPARRIALLRDLDVPLALIRDVIDLPPDRLRQRLAKHRADLDARIWRLQLTSGSGTRYSTRSPTARTANCSNPMSTASRARAD